MASLGIEHALSDVARHVSVSLGAAAVQPGLDMSPLDLIQAADAALYRAKLQGRNQTCRLTGPGLRQDLEKEGKGAAAGH